MKRFLSVILVIAIMASVMPMSFATLTWGGNSISEEMYFEFSSPGHGFSDSKDVNDVDKDGNTTETHPWRALDNEHNKKFESTDSSKSDPWRFVGYNDRASLSLNNGGFAWSFYLDEDYDFNPDGTVAVQPFDRESDVLPRAIMFELQVSESGSFRPVLEYTGAVSGAVFDIYLKRKEDGDTDKTGLNLSRFVKALDRKYFIGTLDTYASAEASLSKDLYFVNLTAGNYYLAFVPTGANENIVYSKGSGNNTGKLYPYSNFKALKFVPQASAGSSYEYLINTAVIKKGGEYGTEGADTEGMPYVTIQDNSKDKSVLWNNKGKYLIYYPKADVMPYLDLAQTAPWTLVDVSSYNSFNVDVNRFHMNALNGDNTNGIVKTTDRFVDGHWAYVGFKVNVPAAGKYSLGVKSCKESDGAFVKFYVLPATANLTRALYNKTANYVGELSFYEVGGNGEVVDENYTDVGTFSAENAGEYYVVCELRKGEGSPSGANSTSTKYDLNGDGVVDSNDKYIRYYYEAKVAGLRLTSKGLSDADKAEQERKDSAKNVDADNAVKEAAVSRDSEVRIFSSVGEVIGTESYTAGGASVTLDAADYTPDGYEFLYWAKGIGLNKHAVCDTEEYTFTPEKGLMNLTAVFREADSEYITVEFYNMNRALVKRYDMTYKAGDEIKMEDLPYMTGLGRAKGWILATDNSSYGAEDSATATGKAMIFVADYDEPESDLVITVNGGTLASGATSSSFAYGDEVTVNAKIRTKDGKKFFAYWKRGDEIVSFEREYTFNAYKSETITAVYSEYETAAQKMRKIVVDSIATGSGSSLIAEFLVDNETVIERGFVFGNGTPTVNDCTYKSTMITDKKQFSIFDDSNLNSRAYAILADGVIYSE